LIAALRHKPAMKAKRETGKDQEIRLPPAHDWRTTDQDEINRRRLRAREEDLKIRRVDAGHPVFSNFHVTSRSGMTYLVEIRDLGKAQHACQCPDFRKNGLGTCKHVEAVRAYLEAAHGKAVRRALKLGSPRVDIVPDLDAGTLCVERNLDRLPAAVRALFKSNGRLADTSPDEALGQLERCGDKNVRISLEAPPFVERLRHAAERTAMRRDYEARVQSGEWPPHETLVPLFPYQREGMLHLAFTERALLADEMGLGKTIQAIAACALLHRLGKAQRALIVTPASLKTEWEEQIQRFTTLPYQLVFGPRPARLKAYLAGGAPFFTIVNYEQMIGDALDVNARLRPDIVVLDEAQRIKNWSTKTAQAIKRLRSRYAFVLTGTPIENRIDELYSLMDFLNPGALGPLFRFNREFYDFDERGKPRGYRNLEQLHHRIQPFMLRRRKADVETELPARTERAHFVPLSDEQKNRYADHEAQVARLAAIAKRRPLTQQEQEKLLRELAMMRMVCDTNYILDPEDRVCPKLAELKPILEECRENPDVKVIVFSEWERMLELVRETCRKMDVGFAWHTGSVPQRRRRAEINAFKTDPSCRVFLSTDSGSTGLNLQNASVVVNCDLPWNPARLEQRIARAWRKNQTRAVTVINLVSEKTIEHRMLETLAHKQALSDGVLDLRGDLSGIRISTGRQAFLSRLQQIMAPPPAEAAPAAAPRMLPADRGKAFCERAAAALRDALVRCDERYPLDGPHSVLVVVVERDAALWRERLAQVHQDLFGSGVSDPLAPVRLEVMDRAAADALERLIEAGVVQRTSRAVRALYPAQAEAAPALSEAEREKAKVQRELALRKLRMGRALAREELADEAREAFLQSIVAYARALAVENRLPEPAEAAHAARPPFGPFWGETHSLVNAYLADAAHPWRPVCEGLQRLLGLPGDR
jgi:hypothetical protein